MTPEAILEAVLRGWVPELLEDAPNKFALEGRPPKLEGVPGWIDNKIGERIAKGEIRARPHKNDSGPTAIAAAYHNAKNRAA